MLKRLLWHFWPMMTGDSFKKIASLNFKRPILTYMSSLTCADIHTFTSSIEFLPSFSRRTRCSWQETKVWNPGATPKPSWSMNGGSSWVWIWTLSPASNDVSSVDKKRWGHLQQGWWFICTYLPSNSCYSSNEDKASQRWNTFQTVSEKQAKKEKRKNIEIKV